MSRTEVNLERNQSRRNVISLPSADAHGLWIYDDDGVRVAEYREGAVTKSKQKPNWYFVRLSSLHRILIPLCTGLSIRRMVSCNQSIFGFSHGNQQSSQEDRFHNPHARSFPPALCISCGRHRCLGGRLRRFTTMLKALPAKTGMAFVLIQHLEPAHQSALASLRPRCNARARGPSSLARRRSLS